MGKRLMSMLSTVEKKYDARSSTKQYNSTSVLESSVSREKKQTLETSLISGSQLHKKDDDCDKSNITKGILKNNHGKMHISSSAKHQNNGASSKDCVPDGSVIKKKRSHPHMDSDIVEKSINSEKCVNVQKKHSTQHILLSKPTTVVPNSRAELMGILVSDASKHFSEVTLKKVKKRLPSKHVHSVAKQHCGLSPTLSSDCVSAMLKRKEETNPICGVSQLHEHKDYANTAITDDKCTHEQIVEQKHPPNHITSENEIAGVLPNMQCSYCVPDANEQKTESSISTYLSLQDVNNERKQSKHSTISDQPYSSVSEDIEKEMVGLPIHTHSLKTHNSKCSLGAEEGQAL
uniref:Uncharacterized protein LOC102806475 n=1 Tax=Saccoglossus kowalevskii TaxID=10224 RepID=A0ABM0MZE0_SACKO|nr:PREDICTED: uncharacterized protein LOC102806475 [Saccoglossus kowalevskii]